ncbi:hypothetical protein RF11_07135 [Thelohanellus kitauei]|uniref:Uncharacterized protein n=1 Tax=Thelohanellus kitauei TaxID=669202 RepID=A0A0C2IXF5_THEKT|nr:hypothetical protein RF11_07135 [Thelohanellus kitauei]
MENSHKRIGSVNRADNFVILNWARNLGHGAKEGLVTSLINIPHVMHIKPRFLALDFVSRHVKFEKRCDICAQCDPWFIILVIIEGSFLIHSDNRKIVLNYLRQSV